MACVGSTFAYEVGEYAYNSTQRFKIDGDNLVSNGNFADGRNGWYGADKETEPNAEVWSTVEGAGPNGENVLESLGATADQPLCNSWSLEPGSYIVSFDLKSATAGYTTIITGGETPTVNNNACDFFINGDGNFKKLASTDEAPVVNVAAQTNFPAEEWKTIVFFCTVEEGQQLVMHFEKLATNTQITNIEIHQAHEVYDVRIPQNRIALAKLMMEDPIFNTVEAAEAKENLVGIIETIEGMIESGDFDDASQAESMMESFESEGLEPFLAVTSTNMNSQITTLDFASLTGVGRGRSFGNAIPNLSLEGGSWGHLSGLDNLMAAIQTGQKGMTAKFTAFNTSFVAGKYFFTAEIRNANTDKTAWPCNPTFNLETTCNVFVGDASEDVVISGEDYTRVYLWGDVSATGEFKAGVYWPGAGDGGAFYIKNVEIRALGDPLAEIERAAAWPGFIAQYNAMVSARNQLISLTTDINYPWANDSLARAQELWDPYYNEFVAKGWVDADGNDTRVATTEELKEWATSCWGFDDPAPSDKYALVRVYQWANNYVIAQNAVISNLAAEISIAEELRDDPMNQSGDKTTFQAAIDAAKSTLSNILASTTDASREADEVTLTAAQTTLQTAEETFKSTVTITPIVSIDFENAAQLKKAEDETEYYSVAGTAGEMTFASGIWDAENEYDTWLFNIGYKEECPGVLHVGGNGYGIVTLPVTLTADDVLRAQFDVWYGNLGKGYLTIDFLNAADEVVAGYSLNRYDGAVAYNDFNNEDNAGMDIKAYCTGLGSSSVGNAGICVDANRSSFDLIIDYKANTVQGTVNNAKNGKCVGAAVAMKEMDDNVITKFRVGSTTYQSANSGAHARRCWFDNLVMYTYKSMSTSSIEAVSTSASGIATGAVYNLQGVRMDAQHLPAGLYIINGRKVVIK